MRGCFWVREQNSFATPLTVVCFWVKTLDQLTARHRLGKSGNGAYLHKVFFWVTLLSSATVVRGGQVASTVYNNANITIIYFHLPSFSPSQLLRYFIPFVEYERENVICSLLCFGYFYTDFTNILKKFGKLIIFYLNVVSLWIQIPLKCASWWLVRKLVKSYKQNQWSCCVKQSKQRLTTPDFILPNSATEFLPIVHCFLTQASTSQWERIVS